MVYVLQFFSSILALAIYFFSYYRWLLAKRRFLEAEAELQKEKIQIHRKLSSLEIKVIVQSANTNFDYIWELITMIDNQKMFIIVKVYFERTLRKIQTILIAIY